MPVFILTIFQSILDVTTRILVIFALLKLLKALDIYIRRN